MQPVTISADPIQMNNQRFISAAFYLPRLRFQPFSTIGSKGMIFYTNAHSAAAHVKHPLWRNAPGRTRPPPAPPSLVMKSRRGGPLLESGENKRFGQCSSHFFSLRSIVIGLLVHLRLQRIFPYLNEAAFVRFSAACQ
jgi:hypothetical protein